jgi:hypothetical protein
MPDEATLKKWIREVLNEGTGAGQTGWASTSATTLGTTQNLVNLVNGLNAKVDALAADVAKLQADA